MSRLALGLLVGLLLGILLTIVIARIPPRRSQPTSVIVNEPTAARQIRTLRPGFDKGARYFKPQTERH
jgi:hypothetical protein